MHAAEFPLLSVRQFGLLDADIQRRANIGLNKGEAHHALNNALRIGRQGEIRDRSSEGSATARPGSTCSPQSSFTGIRPISAKQSDSTFDGDSGFRK